MEEKIEMFIWALKENFLNLTTAKEIIKENGDILLLLKTLAYEK
jgi:hypothetical protein